jgi:hypothetical protein
LHVGRSSLFPKHSGKKKKSSSHSNANRIDANPKHVQLSGERSFVGFGGEMPKSIAAINPNLEREEREACEGV